MANFAIMRTAKVKSVASMVNLEKHCTREKMPKNADQDKARMNRNLIQDELTLSERFAKITHGMNIRKNAVLGIEVVMTYSPEAVKDAQSLSAWVAENQKWLSGEFGEKNVLRLWLHMDESTPHLHAFVVPIDERGKLNCRAYLGGASKLSALQDRYAEAMKPHCLERGIRGSKAHHKTVKEFYRAIENAKSIALPEPGQRTEKAFLGEKVVPETAAEYYQRANDAYRQQNYKLVGLEQQLRKEREKSKREERLNSELSKKTKQYKGKAEAFERLKKGLNELPDKEHARHLKEELQNIVDKQETAELRQKMSAPIQVR